MGYNYFMAKILSLDDFKKVFDQELFKYLGEKKREAIRIDKKCALLIDEVIRFNKAGGKRIRPYICYLGYCLSTKPDSLILPHSNTLIKSCLAVELLESYG